MQERQWYICHSQKPSEMTAGSSKESEKVHVAEGSCPMHKEAVLNFQRDAQLTPGIKIFTTDRSHC